MDFVGAIITIVVGAAVFGIVGFVYYRHNNPKKKKRKGKDTGISRAVNAAGSFARSNSFKFIAPARLVRGDKTADLSAIVVGYFGVMGVKALGYNGEIYGTPSDSEWLQVSDDGTRTYFPNPIDEASADVRVIRDALFSAKLKQIPVEVVCVFTDPKAQIAVPRNAGHLTMKEFKTLLDKEKYKEDTGLDLEKVEGAIRGSVQNEG